MARRVKPEISDEQFKSAISALENKATKKSVCEILGIAYNTKRMDTLIQDWKDQQEFSARMRKEKRKSPCTKDELINIIEAYLEGDTFDELSKRFFRSTAYIKHRLELAGALIRVNKTIDPLCPPMLPEECANFDGVFRTRKTFNKEVENEAEYQAWKNSIIAEHGSDILEVFNRGSKFDKQRAIHVTGQKVWVPAYQCLGEVVSEVPSKQGTAYRVYLLDSDNHRSVCIPYWDLGDLSHLQALGVNIEVIGTFATGLDCKTMLNKALAAARKNKDK